MKSNLVRMGVHVSGLGYESIGFDIFTKQW
jgi:hypothetical protein